MSDPEGTDGKASTEPRLPRAKPWRKEPTLPRTSPLTVRDQDVGPPEPSVPEPTAPVSAATTPSAEPPPPSPRTPLRPAAERLKPRAPIVALSMSERARFAVATLFGLVLALGIHLAIVLALPRFAEQDAFSRLRGTIESQNAVLISGTGGAETWMPAPDPAAAVASCAYDLDDGPVRISARTGSLLQSLAFHARGGGVFYAVTDRAAVRGELDLVVMTRRQLDEALAADDEEEPTRDVRIVSPRSQGFVIVRSVAPLPSLRLQAEEAAKAVSCTIVGEEDEAGPDVPPQIPPAERPAPPPAEPGRR